MDNSKAASDRRLDCDIVMKGGVTSGVIYPTLVARLADYYSLRCIGGTSAGAIAASAAAAAELGRSSGRNPKAFSQLEKLPGELGQVTNGTSALLKKFQPHPLLERHFQVVLEALKGGAPNEVLRRVAWSLIRKFRLGTAAALALAVLAGIFSDSVLADGASATVVTVILIVLVGLVALAVLPLAQAATSFVRVLPQTGFGICTGMGTAEALTPWLEQYLRTCAGLDRPVTFGDLYTAHDQPGLGERKTGTWRAIDLQMMTTAVNLGRPFRLPFEAKGIYFRIEDLQPFFPDVVIDAMVAASRRSATAEAMSRLGKGRFHALPLREDLPVIFCVRMSLAFPILLSAIPLWVADWTRRTETTADGKRAEVPQPVKVWFSDGGLTSNFPIHFFDSALPSRPTFGINLRQGTAERERKQSGEAIPNDASRYVYLPVTNQDRDVHAMPSDLETPTGWTAIKRFLGSAFGTSRSWQDDLHLGQPGFRDRIVHIDQVEGEGGLNLAMPADVIQRLADRGRAAAHELIKKFHPGGGHGGPGWDNHQRIRLRLAVAQLQLYLRGIERRLGTPPPDYVEVARNPTPPSYAWSPTEATAAIEFLEALRSASQAIEASGLTGIVDGAPRPSPELRMGPRV